MLSVDITIAFPRQLEEYALFSDGDNDYGINYQTYVRVAFWIKTESGYVACVQVETDFLEVDLTNFYGDFVEVVSKETAESMRKYDNVKIIG